MVKEIADIRRENLRQLLSQRSGPTALAKALELSGPSFLSQLLSGHRPFSEKSARNFEKKLGLPVGWMDDEIHMVREPGAKYFQEAVAAEDLMTQCVMAVGEELEKAGVVVGPGRIVELAKLCRDHAQHLGIIDREHLARLISLIKK